MKDIRCCVSCRKRKPKEQLFRFTNQGNILDQEQKINARGFYLCQDKSCVHKLKKMLDKNKFNNKLNLDEYRFNELLNDLLKRMEE